MTRAERAAEVARLREQGLNGLRIAERLGLSRSYVYALLNDPTGNHDRERKRTYAGECVDCGAPTDGSNGRGPNATKRCVACSNKHNGEARRVWDREAILDSIQEWALRYGDFPAVADWNPWRARREYNDEARAVRFERAAGRWPTFTTVVDVFGSWNAALQAAGAEPRASHGGGGNQLRRRATRREARSNRVVIARSGASPHH